jgi:hypothetical protein
VVATSVLLLSTKASVLTSRTVPSVYVASTAICCFDPGSGSTADFGAISIRATRGLCRSSLTPSAIQAFRRS